MIRRGGTGNGGWRERIASIGWKERTPILDFFSKMPCLLFYDVLRKPGSDQSFKWDYFAFEIDSHV